MGERAIVLKNGQAVWVDLETGKESGPAHVEFTGSSLVQSERTEARQADPEATELPSFKNPAPCQSEADREEAWASKGATKGGLGLTGKQIKDMTSSMGAMKGQAKDATQALDEMMRTLPLAWKAVGAQPAEVTEEEAMVEERRRRVADFRGRILLVARRHGEVSIGRAEKFVDEWIDAADELASLGILKQTGSTKNRLIYGRGPEWPT